MNEPIINPSTLTKEQIEKLKWLYEGDELNLPESELGYQWWLKGAMKRMEIIFGKEFFVK